MGVTVAGAFAIGAVQVATVAHADVLRADAGVLVAAIASGGVLASFLYGGVPVPGRVNGPHVAASSGSAGAALPTRAVIGAAGLVTLLPAGSA
jgi:hypothetical protein